VASDTGPALLQAASATMSLPGTIDRMLLLRSTNGWYGWRSASLV